MADDLTCRTFDDTGGSVCDRPARFIVWGHLYEKRDKGPKCGRHLPIGAHVPSGFGAPAIYEIPSRTVSTEHVSAAKAAIGDLALLPGAAVQRVLDALGIEVRDA